MLNRATLYALRMVQSNDMLAVSADDLNPFFNCISLAVIRFGNDYKFQIVIEPVNNEKGP